MNRFLVFLACGFGCIAQTAQAQELYTYGALVWKSNDAPDGVPLNDPALTNSRDVGLGVEIKADRFRFSA